MKKGGAFGAELRRHARTLGLVADDFVIHRYTVAAAWRHTPVASSPPCSPIHCILHINIIVFVQHAARVPMMNAIATIIIIIIHSFIFMAIVIFAYGCRAHRSSRRFIAHRGPPSNSRA